MSSKKSKKIAKPDLEISAIVIAKNEEKKIGDCLKSLNWVDEIVVVDNDSKDQTASIAKSFSARVTSFNKDGNYSLLRNKGLREAKGKWVLYVDADERVTSELQQEILDLVNNPETEFEAYAIPRKNIILGKELKYGGWWPDWVKRLFKREFLKGWKNELHEEPIFNGKLGHLKNSLLHIKHDNLAEMVEKTNKWSDIEARLMFEANHPKMNILRFLSAMFREFWLRMVKHKAFLDGSIGVIYALYQVYSRFISYAKLWELQIKNQK